MPMTDYSTYNPPGIEGDIATDYGPPSYTSKVNADAVVIPFGRMVCRGAGDDDAVLPSASNLIPLGVAPNYSVYEEAKNSSSEKGTPIKYQFPVLRKGVIWVWAEEAVAPGDAVYFRHQGHTTPIAGQDVIGRFRNDADADDEGGTPDTCTLLPGASWASSTAGPGLAKLELNLP